jgi:hypothetical protein
MPTTPDWNDLRRLAQDIRRQIMPARVLFYAELDRLGLSSLDEFVALFADPKSTRSNFRWRWARFHATALRVLAGESVGDFFPTHREVNEYVLTRPDDPGIDEDIPF